MKCLLYCVCVCVCIALYGYCNLSNTDGDAEQQKKKTFLSCMALLEYQNRANLSEGCSRHLHSAFVRRINLQVMSVSAV